MKCLALALAVLAAGCGNPNKNVVGYWTGVQEKTPVAIGFTQDGTALIKHSGKLIKRHYRFVDNTIEFLEFEGDGPAIREGSRFPILLEWKGADGFVIGDPVKSFLPQLGTVEMKRATYSDFEAAK